MGLRDSLGEIDGLVLAFIGLTVILALSAYMEMGVELRVALGVPVVLLMVVVGFLRWRKKAL
jgi:uncharacterized membrane protein YobD (UPF0266 family)